jgi:hypothetical protein
LSRWHKEDRKVGRLTLRDRIANAWHGKSGAPAMLLVEAKQLLLTHAENARSLAAVAGGIHGS